MIAAALSFLGFIKSFVLKALEFCLAHWRIVLPALAAAALVWYIHGLRAELAAEKKQFVDYQAAIEKAYIDQVADNVRKERESEASKLQVAQAYLDQYQRLRAYYEPLTQKQATDLRQHTDAIDILEHRLRVEADSYRSGLSGLLETARVSAKGGADCDAELAGRDQYIGVLEQACAMTTADYNTLRKSWDAECDIKECK